MHRIHSLRVFESTCDSSLTRVHPIRPGPPVTPDCNSQHLLSIGGWASTPCGIIIQLSFSTFHRDRMSGPGLCIFIDSFDQCPTSSCCNLISYGGRKVCFFLCLIAYIRDNSFGLLCAVSLWAPQVTAVHLHLATL